MPAFSSTFMTPSMKTGGVDGLFATKVCSDSSSYATRSVNVPPMSIATRSFRIKFALPPEVLTSVFTPRGDCNGRTPDVP
jgi:hypothetical protein